jgi:hypothetical protein
MSEGLLLVGDLVATIRLWSPTTCLNNRGSGAFKAAICRVSRNSPAVADLCADPRESQIGRHVFRQISNGFEPAIARQALAWIILNPEDGQAVTKAPELGLFRHPPERLVRQRSVIYAEKYLGRLLGKIPD